MHQLVRSQVLYPRSQQVTPAEEVLIPEVLMKVMTDLRWSAPPLCSRQVPSAIRVVQVVFRNPLRLVLPFAQRPAHSALEHLLMPAILMRPDWLTQIVPRNRRLVLLRAQVDRNSCLTGSLQKMPRRRRESRPLAAPILSASPVLRSAERRAESVPGQAADLILKIRRPVLLLPVRRSLSGSCLVTPTSRV